MKRVVCLYRVSTTGQVDHDDIPMQKIACREYAATHPDWEIVEEIAEKGVSGYKISTNERDAIIEIKKMAMARKFDVLLVFMFDRLVYLRFITRKNNISTDNLISQIHQFCVRDSFEKLGWLYTSNDYLPPKPVLNFDRKLFLSVLYDQLSKTYNDAKRLLFTSMIHIVEASSDNEKLTIEASFGVETFETVWERLIDHIFGEEDRSRYFPRGEWHIVDGIDEHIVSSVLKPDTIIEYDQKYYVLDAKYYKYGITRNPQNLPPTESIQKQITYARFIEKHFAEGRKIRNAFIIPFNRGDETNDPYKFVAAGTADWEDYGLEAPDYMYVLAILADTRYLIKTYTRYNAIEIERMTSVIEEALINYRGIVIYPTAQLEEDMQF